MSENQFPQIYFNVINGILMISSQTIIEILKWNQRQFILDNPGREQVHKVYSDFSKFVQSDFSTLFKNILDNPEYSKALGINTICEN